MGQIPPFLGPVVGLVIIFVAGSVARRRLGWKGLLYVWVASAFIMTGIYFARVYFSAGALSTGEIAFVAAYLFMLFTFFSGAVVWGVAILGPRHKYTFLTEMNDLSLAPQTGKLEDHRGLTGIRRRYQELLATYATALNEAPRNPYPSILRAIRIDARESFSTSVWDIREKVRQAGPIPNVLILDLTGAEAVLAELEMLTAAQLAAIEECHRMNVRRLRQRSISEWKWRSLITAVIGVVSLFVTIVKEVSGANYSGLLPVIREINLTGADLHSSIILWVISMLAIGLMMVIIDFIVSRPRLYRLQAFEDILTIAKAYRKGDSETTKPLGEPLLTVTG